MANEKALLSPMKDTQTHVFEKNSKAIVKAGEMDEMRMQNPPSRRVGVTPQPSTTALLPAAAFKHPYTLVRRTCLLNLFALYAYGFVYEDRRYQKVTGSSRAFSSQEINMAYLAFNHLPLDQARLFIEVLDTDALLLLQYWLEGNDRRLLFFSQARARSIAGVFGSDDQFSALFRLEQDEEEHRELSVDRSNVGKVALFHHVDRVRFDEISNIFAAKGKMDEVKEILPAVPIEGTPTVQALQRTTISAARKAELIACGVDDLIIEEACAVLDQSFNVEKFNVDSVRQITAADVKNAIDVSLYVGTDVKLWTAVKIHFGDLFAGGLTSFDAGDELHHYSMYCPL